ncbi:MAG TPA: VWA domain-containing protein [Polyangiaceae bacterium]
MTFLTALALAVAVLAVAPYLAHRLRRRRAEEQTFPPARLVPATLPMARRRSRLEDKALFATRAAAVVLLAALGATPLVRCSRLSLQRSSGASVAMAIVMDDSMSMRAGAPGRSRFERARQAALEILASAREGDAAGIVLAGAPARVGLAPTTDLGAVRTALLALSESDRATDLDAGLSLAHDLLSSMPQSDRRVVLLSDLADGHADAPPLGESSPDPVWIALPELRAEGVDCAIARAQRSGAKVVASVRCGPGAGIAGREVVVEDAHGKVIGRASPSAANEVTVLLPSEDAVAATARLTGEDAVAADDVAPVLPATARGAVAVVADATTETVVTGGAPIFERALSALKLDVDVRPIPDFPDRVEDLAGTLGVMLDDPPGLTPEQRRALASYLDGGGVLLLALGPRAAAAPLGATLEPILRRAVGWSETSAPGADPASAEGEMASSAETLFELHAPRRAVLAADDVSAFVPLVKWRDGAPLVARKAVGRGVVWIVTLPVSIDQSDLALRPGFLALLEGWAREARDRAATKETVAGATWRFAGARDVTIEGPGGPVRVDRDASGLHASPPRLGTYRLTVDGVPEIRVATVPERELDLRPRAAAEVASGRRVGERRATVDVSGTVALLLLAATAIEMALRLWTRRAEA